MTTSTILFEIDQIVSQLEETYEIDVYSRTSLITLTFKKIVLLIQRIIRTNV